MKKADLLQELLKESYQLLILTHVYHWQVRGPNFQSLHLLFQGQYTELFQAVDIIAERIKSLAIDVKEFEKLEIYKKMESKSKDMLKHLVDKNNKIIEISQKLVGKAQKEKDEATADLAIERISVHQKNIWMLKSSLED